MTTMTETVTNTNERKSLFSSFLEVLEARDNQIQLEKQLEEEKYQRRTQRIYDFHERQRREAVELQRCLQYVSQHAHVLESVLRGAGGGGGAGEGVPLAAALLRQAAALQRSMAQCVANAARIRQLLTAAHRPQMDTMLAKMEAELSAWTAFLQRAVDAAYNSEVVVDNLHNLIAEQRRCVREVASSHVLTALCEPAALPSLPSDGSSTPHAARTPRTPHTPHTPTSLERRAPSAVSTPIQRA